MNTRQLSSVFVVGTLMSFVLCTTSVLAQSQSLVMPRGLQDMAGNSGDGGIWEEPEFRLVVIYDSSQFPWDPTQPFTIHGFRVRRNSLLNFEYGDTPRSPVIRLSVDGPEPQMLNTLLDGGQQEIPFAALDGNATSTITFTNPVDFPCHEAIEFQVASQFRDRGADFVFPAGKEYVVPANTKNLVLDIHVTQTTQNRWIVDHESVQGFDRGGFRRIGHRCPQLGVRACGPNRTPRSMDDVGMTGMIPGRPFRLWLIPDQVSATTQACLWLGPVCDGSSPMCPSPITLFNGCVIEVFPLVALPMTLTTNLFDLSGSFPNDPSVVGFKLGVQYAVAESDPSWPQLGVTAGYEITIGSGQPLTSRFAAVFADTSSGRGLPTTGQVIGSVPIIEFY